ncbi:thioredoxin domain-containing protein, partial [Rhodococcus erythropolis]|uniref:DsbA family protein n=1 Tax=Rhodococcus erythropolis TaxID=1833 RepID=UPI00294A136D
MRGSMLRLGLVAGLAAAVVACSPSTGAPPSTSPTRSASAAGEELAVLDSLDARMASDGVAIEVGPANAPTTVTVYEDFQCPYCARFEHVNGPELAARAAAGEVNVHYIFVSLLDRNLGGRSSAGAAHPPPPAREAPGISPNPPVLFARPPLAG